MLNSPETVFNDEEWVDVELPEKDDEYTLIDGTGDNGSIVAMVSSLSVEKRDECKLKPTEQNKQKYEKLFGQALLQYDLVLDKLDSFPKEFEAPEDAIKILCQFALEGGEGLANVINKLSILRSAHKSHLQSLVTSCLEKVCKKESLNPMSQDPNSLLNILVTQEQRERLKSEPDAVKNAKSANWFARIR